MRQTKDPWLRRIRRLFCRMCKQSYKFFMSNRPLEDKQFFFEQLKEMLVRYASQETDHSYVGTTVRKHADNTFASIFFDVFEVYIEDLLDMEYFTDWVIKMPKKPHSSKFPLESKFTDPFNLHEAFVPQKPLVNQNNKERKN